MLNKKFDLKKLAHVATVGVASVAMVVPLTLGGFNANTNVHAESRLDEQFDKSANQALKDSAHNKSMHGGKVVATPKVRRSVHSIKSKSRRSKKSITHAKSRLSHLRKARRHASRKGKKSIDQMIKEINRNINHIKGHRTHHAGKLVTKDNVRNHAKHLSYYTQGKNLGKYIHNRKDDNYGGVQYLLNNKRFSNKNFRNGYYKGYITAFPGDDENPKPRAKAAFKIVSAYQASHNKMFRRGVVDGIKADYYGKPSRRYAHNKEYQSGFKLFKQIERFHD